MATFKEDVTLKYKTAKDSDEEETSFSAGDEVTLVQEWKSYFLIKDNDGHYYNVEKDKLDK